MKTSFFEIRVTYLSQVKYPINTDNRRQDLEAAVHAAIGHKPYLIDTFTNGQVVMYVQRKQGLDFHIINFQRLLQRLPDYMDINEIEVVGYTESPDIKESSLAVFRAAWDHIENEIAIWKLDDAVLAVLMSKEPERSLELLDMMISDSDPRYTLTTAQADW